MLLPGLLELEELLLLLDRLLEDFRRALLEVRALALLELFESDIFKCQRCDILHEQKKSFTKKTGYLFFESGSDANSQGQCEAEAVDRQVPHMLSDKHRPERKRIHWHANQFT